jgi:myo-inositol-1(or 4)-monophosphatase
MYKLNTRIKQVAIMAADKAGKELLKEYHRFNRESVKVKAKHEIVTKADLISEKLVLKEIRKHFPNHEILSEEKGKIKTESDYRWIVDPLDGTTNFSIHNPLWAVSIGVAYKAEVVFGVVYAPYLDELFVAEKGKGAKLNNKSIKVSTEKQAKTINAFCHGSRQRDIRKALKFVSYQKLRNLDCRQLGAASIELAYVAAGRIESIMIPGAHAWDVAAGVLIVREAGGRVTDFSGKRWTLKSEDMLASNGKVHSELLKVINK